MGIFNIFKKKTNENDCYKYYSDDLREYCLLRDKYQPYWNEHFKNLEKIDKLYSKAIKELNINNNYTSQVIELCLKDISISQDLMDFSVKQAKINKQDVKDNIPIYPSFTTLAKIYEKQMKYEEAIKICEKAIKIGYLNDGTKGGYNSRIEKLKNKIKR